MLSTAANKEAERRVISAYLINIMCYSMPPQFFLAYSLSIAISSLLQQVPTENSDPAAILLYLEYTDTHLKFSSNPDTYISHYRFETLVILLRIGF